MPPPVRRRFTLADGMILIAATAIGLAAMRIYLPRGRYSLMEMGARGGWLDRVVRDLSYCLPMFACWTIAVLILRLRKPRPPFRRLWKQPGAVAGLAVSVTVISNVVMLGAIKLTSMAKPSLFVGAEPAYTKFLASTHPGAAVAASWMLLTLAGRWRPERSVLDRTGRLFGVLWILWWPVTFWVIAMAF